MSEFNLSDEQLELLVRSVESVMAGASEKPGDDEVAEYARLMEMRSVLRREMNNRGILHKAPCDEHRERLIRLERETAHLSARVEELESFSRDVNNTPMAGTAFARNYQATQTRIQKVEERVDALEKKG